MHGTQQVPQRGAVTSARAPNRPETMLRTPQTDPLSAVTVPQAAAPRLTIGPGGQAAGSSQTEQSAAPLVSHVGSGIGLAQTVQAGIAGAQVTQGGTGMSDAAQVSHDGAGASDVAQATGAGAGMLGAAQALHCGIAQARHAARVFSPLKRSQGFATQTVQVSCATGAPQVVQAGA